MSIVANLYNSIKKGKQGFNQGLSTGMPKLDSLIYGVQRRWINVVAGDSGSGKSSFTLYTQVYQPFKQYMENPTIDIHFLLFSFEMSSEVLLAKLLSMYIYDKYNKIISYQQILSLDSVISDEDLGLVISCEPWLKKFESLSEIVDKPVTAKGLYGYCKGWSQKFGEYKEGEKVGEYINTEYIPNNENQYLIVVVDHIKLLTTNTGHTSKQEIDEACDYLIYFRNKCNFTITIVQQLNRNFKSDERRAQGMQLLQLNDLSDSSGTSNAAEAVIGIFYPYREKMGVCEGYNIRQLKHKFRLIQLLKHRFGQADKSIGCNFMGSIGKWIDMPLPTEINDYSIYSE